MEKTAYSFLQECTAHWRWFLASGATMTLVAVLFLLFATPQYRRTTDIMVKDETSPASMLANMTGAGMFANLGFSITSNVDNELEVFLSPALMMEVVKDNQFDLTYTTGNGPFRQELYGQTLPVKAVFASAKDTDRMQLRATLHADGTLVLTDFRKDKDKLDGEVRGRLNTVCRTPIGPVTLLPTATFPAAMQQEKDYCITITKQPPYEATERILKKMKGDVLNNNTSIVQLSYDDAFSERAERILSELTRVYLKAWQADKEQEAQASTDFIDQRIAQIEQSLTDYDVQLADYERDNLQDIGGTTPGIMASAAANINSTVLRLNNERYVLKHMQQLMRHDGKGYQVLPGNILPDNDNIAKQIAAYNTLVLKRQNLAENSSDRNPLVRELDAQLAPMHEAIAGSITNALSQIEIQLKGMAEKENELTGKLVDIPEKYTKALPAQRQQKVVESLYIYLLQKREENRISKAFRNQNIRVVTPPMGKLRPVFPRKLWTLAAAWLLAVLLPTTVLYLRRLNPTEERRRDDATATGE